MTLTQASVDAIAEQFRNGNPDDQYKQSPRVSRRELVATLYDSIIAKRKAGYSYDGIIAYLGQLGAPMSVSTLKSYLVQVGKQAATKHGKTRKQPVAHATPKLEDTRRQLPATTKRASSPETRGNSESQPSLAGRTEARSGAHDAKAEAPASVEATRLRSGVTPADGEVGSREKEAVTSLGSKPPLEPPSSSNGAYRVPLHNVETSKATAPLLHAPAARESAPDVAPDDARKLLDEVRSRASSPAVRRMAFVPRDDRDL